MQFGQQSRTVSTVNGEKRFRHLDRQPRCGEAGIGQNLLDEIDEGAVLELLPGDIDRNIDILGQLTASAQASASTHFPSGTISPDFSATGMNMSGRTTTSPNCQRNSASNPLTRFVVRSTIGWVFQEERLLLERQADVLFHLHSLLGLVGERAGRRG
jgi:hypothetical protein